MTVSNTNTLIKRLKNCQTNEELTNLRQSHEWSNQEKKEAFQQLDERDRAKIQQIKMSAIAPYPHYQVGLYYNQDELTESDRVVIIAPDSEPGGVIKRWDELNEHFVVETLNGDHEYLYPSQMRKVDSF